MITEDDIGHPVHQFQIIRRSLNDLRDLADQFDEMNRNTLRVEDFDLPTQDDFKGNAFKTNKLFRLRDFYAMKTRDSVAEW